MTKMNTILIRYGEIFLKGNNKSFFESALIRNIKHAIKDIDCSFLRGQSRYYIEDFCEDDRDELLVRLRRVFGIHSLSLAAKIDYDFDKVCGLAAEISPKKGKFRVTVRRADKRIKMRSMQIAAEIGGFMLQNAPDLTVDLFNFDFELNVDIRENGKAYLFYDKIPCECGLPYTTSGAGMLLLSGGIDSPVAAYLMAKRGVKILAVHYHSYPYTGELALQKVKDLAAELGNYHLNIQLFVVPFTKIQYAIHQNCPQEVMITIMRRFMMRIAQILAKKHNCKCLITGESLGQVASQTMESINVTNSVVQLPVFRPLIGMDKTQIIQISKKINTFDISIRPYEDCCTVFLPKNPIIHPRLDYIEGLEKKLDIDALIAEAIDNTETHWPSNSQE